MKTHSCKFRPFLLGYIIITPNSLKALVCSADSTDVSFTFLLYYIWLGRWYQLHHLPNKFVEIHTMCVYVVSDMAEGVSHTSDTVRSNGDNLRSNKKKPIFRHLSSEKGWNQFRLFLLYLISYQINMEGKVNNRQTCIWQQFLCQ